MRMLLDAIGSWYCYLLIHWVDHWVTDSRMLMNNVTLSIITVGLCSKC
jgi:hypothetical protein